MKKGKGALPENAAPTKRLTAVDILGLNDKRTVDVSVPDWGGFVTLGTLTAADAEKWSTAMRENRQRGMVLLIVMCAIDGDGARMFDESAIEELQKKQMKNIQHLATEAMKLNSMDEPEQRLEAAKND